MTAVLVVAVLLPLAGAMAAAMLGRSRSELGGRIDVLAQGAAFLLAVILAIAVATTGQVSATIQDGAGTPVLGLYVNRVGVILLLLVLGVSVVVQSFSRRYLRGDRQAAQFFAAAGLLTGASAVLVTAVTLLVLAVAWTVAGAALCLLLGLYWHLPAARQGVRRTLRTFVIGDVALWAAVVLTTVQWGNLDLRTLGERATSLSGAPAWVAVVACLLVVAAMARSAQFPLHSWLPATLAAPTPVSAMLHAGVVNAGGVLLIVTSPLFASSSLALSVAFVAGAVTAIYGTTLMMAKNDVKGALAHSTMGQMGFMIMTCGLGWFGAALFHLTAHGMYKATLFLGSGSAVHNQVQHRKAPPLQSLSRFAGIACAVVAAALPALVIVAVAALFPPPAGGGNAEVLLVFAWASAAWAAWGWLRRYPSVVGGVLAAVGISLLVTAYVLVINLVTGFVAPVLPVTSGVSAWLLVLPIAAMASIVLVTRAQRSPFLVALHRRLYVTVLSAGYVLPARRSPRGDRTFSSTGPSRLVTEVAQ